MFSYLLKFQAQRIGRYFKNNKAAKSITIVLFALVFLSIAFGVYKFFNFGAATIDSDSYLYFRNALVLYVFEVFFLLVYFLLLISSAITALFSLFDENTSAIIASPSFQKNTVWSWIVTELSSLWIFLFVLVPAVIGVLPKKNIILSGAISLLQILTAVTAIVLTSYIIIFIVSHILRLFKARVSKKKLAFILVGIFSIIFVIIAYQIKSFDIATVLEPGNLALTVAPVSQVAKGFVYFPSTISALGMYSERLGSVVPALEVLGILIFTDAVLFLLFKLSSKNYLIFWQEVSEGNELKEPSRKKLRLSFLLKTKTGALFYKEMIETFRNQRNVLWLFFLLILWVSNIGLSIVLKNNLQSGNYLLPNLPGLVLAIQAVILSYFIAALVLRFAFIAFSSEKKTSWILGSAPIKYSEALLSKFIFYTCCFGLVGLITGVINNCIFGGISGHFTLVLVSSVISAIILTAYGMSLGAFFPNFQTDDPQQTSNTLPGLALIFGSILYGFIEAFFLYNFVIGNIRIYLLIIFFVLVGFLVFYLLWLSGSSLNKRDFAEEED
jgi:ABC-2 type transport system permease protein